MRNRLLGAVNWILRNDLVILALTIPLVIVAPLYSWRSVGGWPGPLAVLGLATIAVFWIVRWIWVGHPAKATRLDLPIILLVLAMAIGLAFSVCPPTTLRCLAVLLAGVAVFYGLVNSLRSTASVRLGLVASLACMAVLGLVFLAQIVSTQMGDTFRPILDRVGFPWGFIPDTWFDPDTVSGVLSMSMPVMVAFAVTPGQGRGALAWLKVVSVAGLVMLMLACMVLSRAWAELAAIGVTALMLPCLYSRRWRLLVWVLSTALLLSVAAFWLIGTPALRELPPLWPLLDDWLRSVYPSRWEVWTRALYMLESYPFTGIGMGMFSIVAQNNYPYFEAGLNQMPHAHNVYLQTALDGGLLGLAAILSLVPVFFAGARRSVDDLSMSTDSGSRLLRAMQIGLAGGFSVFLISGLFDDALLTDAFASLALWILLGLAEAARQVRPVRTPVPLWGSSGRAKLGRVVGTISTATVLVAAAILLPVRSLFQNNMGNIARDRAWLACDDGGGDAQLAISALDHYRRTLVSGRSLGLSYRSWGDLLFRAHHPGEAAMHLAVTPGYTPDDGREAFWGEVARLTEGENPIAYLERAVWRRPTDPFAHLFLAEAYLIDGNEGNAAREYLAAGAPAEFLVTEAGLAAGLGDRERLRNSLGVAARMEPDSADVYLACGTLHLKLGDYAEAVDCFLSMLQVVPGAPEGYWWLGEVYRIWGKGDHAVWAYEQAVALASDESQYHRDLARAYRESGRLEDALDSFEKALSLDPDNEALAQELAQLRNK